MLVCPKPPGFLFCCEELLSGSNTIQSNCFQLRARTARDAKLDMFIYSVKKPRCATLLMSEK